MGQEIERKYRVVGDAWRSLARAGEPIRQGYLAIDRERSVRVRLRNGRGTLTIKGARRGAARTELEYDIPAEDAEAMLESLAIRPVIDKVRHLVEVDGWTFEVDAFSGENQGLVVAEIELPDEAAEHPQPSWLGEDVTEDARYYNTSLVEHPYSTW